MPDAGRAVAGPTGCTTTKAAAPLPGVQAKVAAPRPAPVAVALVASCVGGAANAHGAVVKVPLAKAACR